MTRKEEGIKCVVWDLDNTLWDGILTESDAVVLKPEIRTILHTLDQRGILLSIASKNNFDDAAAKLRELGLWDYFLFPEIHWSAKSSSITNIRENLNIGMDTIMFVDDNPFERDEVAKVHPEVVCVDAAEYLRLLDDPLLNPRFITADSARRRIMYMENQERKRDEESFTGPDEEFLASLNMRFAITEACEDDLARAVELTVRTNQLNATGRTYSYDELDALRRSDRHKLFMCELVDRYGSYGKIGLALVECTDTAWHLRLLLMSCRVMSRGVGTVLLGYLMQRARDERVRLLADFVNTGRNRAMYIAFKFNGFNKLKVADKGAAPAAENDRIELLEGDLDKVQSWPDYLTVLVPEQQRAKKAS